MESGRFVLQEEIVTLGRFTKVLKLSTHLFVKMMLENVTIYLTRKATVTLFVM